MAILSVLLSLPAAGGSGPNPATGVALSGASAPANLPVTVETNPPGLAFTVDGTPCTSSQMFNWSPGSSHTIATTSPQDGGPGTRYTFAHWSDWGDATHTITPSAGETYTASFSTEFLLTVSMGKGGSSVSPPSGWYIMGMPVILSAAAAYGYEFSGWSGSGAGGYSGSANPAMAFMNGPITETALFSQLPPAGPTYQFAANDAETSTTSTSYVGKVSLSFNPPVSEDWVIFGFCEFKCVNVEHATFVQLFVDSTGEGQNTRKPVGVNDYMPFVTVKVKNLPAGPHTMRLMFKTGSTSATAYVRNARICAVRKAALEMWSAAQDSGVPLTSTLTDIVSLYIFPPTTGSYLVISTAEVNATTAVSTDVQTFCNGTLNDEGLIRAADNGDFTTFMSFNYIPNAPAGVFVVHKIAAKKAAADTANHYIRRSRILALRLSGGRFRYAAIASANEQNTTQTTLQQALTSTWTYGANGKWLFLNSARVSNSSTSYSTQVRVQLNNSATCGDQLMKPKHATDLLNYSSIDIRNLTTPRTVDMDYRTTNAAGTAKVKRLRFYGLPLDGQ